VPANYNEARAAENIIEFKLKYNGDTALQLTAKANNSVRYTTSLLALC